MAAHGGGPGGGDVTWLFPLPEKLSSYVQGESNAWVYFISPSTNILSPNGVLFLSLTLVAQPRLPSSHWAQFPSALTGPPGLPAVPLFVSLSCLGFLSSVWFGHGAWTQQHFFPEPAWGPQGQGSSAQLLHSLISVCIPPFSSNQPLFTEHLLSRKHWTGSEGETQMNLTWGLPFRRLRTRESRMDKSRIVMSVMRDGRRSCGNSEGRRSLLSGHTGSLEKRRLRTWGSGRKGVASGANSKSKMVKMGDNDVFGGATEHRAGQSSWDKWQITLQCSLRSSGLFRTQWGIAEYFLSPESQNQSWVRENLWEVGMWWKV